MVISQINAYKRMIITAIINLIYAFVYLITSPMRLLPAVTLPSDFTTAITTAGGYAQGLNAILPINTIIFVFGIFALYEAGYFSWKLLNWVIRKIPTIS